MAPEPVPARELGALHERIGGVVGELRARVRARPPRGSRGSGEAVRATLEVLHAIRATPSLAARVGVTLLVVAGIAAVLAAWARHQEPGRDRHASTTG